jgi:hypothetical protein
MNFVAGLSPVCKSSGLLVRCEPALGRVGRFVGKIADVVRIVRKNEAKPEVENAA